MTVARLLALVIYCFPLSELALAFYRRASHATATTRDRGSLYLLWGAIGVGVTAAVFCQNLAFGRLPVAASVLHPVALAILLLGLAIRWTAILSLGRFFTVNVAIARDHRLVDTGLYRSVRHPSYSGLLLAFLGMGLAFRNGLGMLLMLLPIVAALGRRIAIEEQALHAAFGAEYEAYAARSWRLVPWLY